MKRKWDQGLHDVVLDLKPVDLFYSLLQVFSYA